MEDLPFGSDIRSFIWKINEEKERVNKILTQRARTMDDEEHKWWQTGTCNCLNYPPCAPRSYLMR